MADVFHHQTERPRDTGVSLSAERLRLHTSRSRSTFLISSPSPLGEKSCEHGCDCDCGCDQGEHAHGRVAIVIVLETWTSIDSTGQGFEGTCLRDIDQLLPARSVLTRAK